MEEDYIYFTTPMRFLGGNIFPKHYSVMKQHGEDIGQIQCIY